MARIQGIAGGMSGKMGSVVFRQDRGTTVVAQYQPAVKNPNTTAQQAQRAKFKLMSQLAAIMSPGLGTISVAERPARQRPSQRNAFVQKNFELVEVEKTESGMVATIPMEQLQLTSSFRDFGTISVAADNGFISAELTRSDAATKGGKIVLVGYGTMIATKSPRIIAMRDFDFDANGEAAVEFDNLDNGDYTVLVYGYIPSDELLAKIGLDNIHTPNDTPFVGQVNLDQALANGSVACTMTIGTNVSLL